VRGENDRDFFLFFLLEDLAERQSALIGCCAQGRRGVD
jgi:hypothetical protein